MDSPLDDYILAHSAPEPPLLHALWRDTQLRLAYGQMASGALQGGLLTMLVRMIRPRRILEVGTFSGYSALAMAEGMTPEAELHTIEVDDELEDFIRGWFARSPHADKLHLHIGDALSLIPTLAEPWDMAYIDADKRHYTDYYEQLVPRLTSGGYILADDTLWYGRITETARPADLQLQGLQRFNDCVATDPRVEPLILPIRHGLTIIRKR